MDPVVASVAAAFAAHRRVVLAVSGGLDSMVLLDAAARVARHRISAVATFDHRTGPHSSRAVEHVQREAAVRGLPVVVGTADGNGRGEAAWRDARWRFLDSVADDRGARVATAHTRDDQVETICIRVLRDAGARGLAGLYAPGRVIRPLVSLARDTLVRYGADHEIGYVEDPTNASRGFLRNRLRLDLLPAIAKVDPRFAGDMLELARRAARLRGELDELAASPEVSRLRPGAEVEVSPATFAGSSEGAVRGLVPAVAARAGIILDRRGTTRLSSFILKSRPGASIQLSGGAEAVRERELIVIRRTDAERGFDAECALGPEAAVGCWRFRRMSRPVAGDEWAAALPTGVELTVRGWRAGDRMRAAGSPAARRVKRFLRDAGISGPDRIGWPVVLADGEIVWIPGVRRSDAATERSGRPALRYRCERNDA
jgi:tRNA(Ile)-lysidine synthase